LLLFPPAVYYSGGIVIKVIDVFTRLEASVELENPGSSREVNQLGSEAAPVELQILLLTGGIRVSAWGCCKKKKGI
jgi:hypothetical protein